MAGVAGSAAGVTATVGATVGAVAFSDADGLVDAPHAPSSKKHKKTPA